MANETERDPLRIIAIDFDGCLWADGWPNMSDGRIITSTVEKMYDQLKQNPHTEFILWTCRAGDQLNQAIAICKEHSLPIHYFNEHHPKAKKWFGKYGMGPKIYAHEYWDDKAVNVKEAAAN